MRVHLIITFCWIASIGLAQKEEARVTPNVTTVTIDEDAVTVLHLAVGYTTSVRLPEGISSVVIGNPASFKAEHSDVEPLLVFLKPITMQPSESNALITTNSGHEISLQLVSTGKPAASVQVDFLIEFRRPESMLINSYGESFLVSETRPVLPVEPSAGPIESVDLLAKELEEQKNASPPWKGRELLGAIGDSVQHNHQTILGFSILNSSKRVIEMLPPQLELSGTAHGSGGKRIKADPVPISEYRMTTRRLIPGERADGIVVFERPAFKQSSETLQLQFVEAERVDRPILLSVPFTVSSQGAKQ